MTHLSLKMAVDRRFVLRGALAAIGAAVSGCTNETVEHFSERSSPYSSAPSAAGETSSQAFKMKFAPHYGMFTNLAGSDYIDQMTFAAEEGFRAWEDNILHWRSEAQQAKIAEVLRRNAMELGVFIAADLTLKPGLYLTAGDPEAREYFLTSIKETLPVVSRFGSKWVTILLGDRHPSLPRQYQMVNIINALRRAADIVEPAGVTMAIEPVNSLVQRPTIFLDSVRDAFLLCQAVNRPSWKILFDIYHHQIMNGNILGDVNHTWEQIAYFQVADYPGRNEPTTGEINYANVFQHLQAKGYRGIVGMEHGVNGAGPDGERALIEAYRYCDRFLR
ncbi:TIM barrel protein [Sinorhizobium sp. BJ1]|uniref:hydroxypyruvate isomerase family protein n=1 Tax=Sinorhizobium sp. BJ1 TaxID=2035455 RepID=UPI0015CF39B9|nr:TIM barrel protein [Sinorhizobium sp. BJ1]